MKLAEKADVIVENFRSEVKFRLGVDYESVKKVNQRIVYGSISGFGQTGPYAKRPGVDQIAQGMGGLMSITGLPGQGPVRVGIPIDDLCAGSAAGAGDPDGADRTRAVGRGAMGPHLAARSADFHARFPGLALADRRRGREAGRQRPPDRHPDRAVPDRGRADQHRRLGRQSVAALLRGGRRAVPAQRPGLQDRPAALEKPQGAEREDRRDHQEAPERLLGRVDERGRRAVRPALHDRPDLRRPAGRSISKWRARCIIRSSAT